MTRTKTTPHAGSSSHRHRGMATARLPGTEGEPAPQGATGEDTEDSQGFPDVLEDAKKKGDNPGTSKSEGKIGDQPEQVEGGAEAPPKENPPPPPPTTEPLPSTSKDPTDAPEEVPTQDPTEEVEEETPPILTV